MSFFDATLLQAVRDNPDDVASLYASTRDDFIVALDLAGLSEDAIKAAWCTVVAYDLVPYGPDGPASRELAPILAADNIACAHYVSLAWHLIDKIGVATDLQTAVGWDDGAIANHAQMLYSDGTSNLLLDPTIGLIVNGVTYSDLINGTAYTDYASFYDRDDITDFNATVIDAFVNGRYEVRDTIYYVPTLDNWMNQTDEFNGIVIDHADGSRTTVGYLDAETINGSAIVDIVYGGKGDDVLNLGDGTDVGYGGKDNDILNGEAGNDTLYGEDGDDHLNGGTGDNVMDGGAGHDRVIYSDPMAAFTFNFIDSQTVEVAGPGGTDTLSNIEEIVFSDQVCAGHTVIEADIADQFPWDTITKQLDLYGNQLSSDALFADNSTIHIDFDTYSQNAWMRLETYFNPSAERTVTVYRQDDGTTIVYDYDPDHLYAWSSIETQLNGSEQATLILYQNDDQTRIAYEYDLAGASAWNTLETHYDTQGRVTTIGYQNDDGSLTFYQYDLDSLASWSSVVSSYNSSQDLEQILYNNDDGTHVVYQYDPGDGWNWSQLATYFDSFWVRTHDVTTFDDGLHTVRLFDEVTGLITETYNYTADWTLIT